MHRCKLCRPVQRRLQSGAIGKEHFSSGLVHGDIICVLKLLAGCTHDARLYGSVLLSYCIRALCALHDVFLHPHGVHMCRLLNKAVPIF